MGLDREDLDLDAFRDGVLGALVAGDDPALARAAEAVMAPIFVEKMIDEIVAGNPWRGVLYLMARRLLEASPPLRDLEPSLRQKRELVADPDAGVEDLLEIEQTEGGMTLRLRP